MKSAAAATRGPSARAWRIVAGIVAALLIAGALAITALRLALLYVPGHAAKLQAWIERETRMHVEYSQLDARLRWYGPEIVLRDVRVLDTGGTQALFVTREGSVGLDVWNFFRTGQLVAGRVRFVAPVVTIVRFGDDRIRLLGQSDQPSDRPPFELDRLPAGRLVIENATVIYRNMEDGLPPVQLDDLDLEVRRDRGFVLAEGSAQLPQSLGKRVDFSLRLKGSLENLRRLDARVELRTDELRLAGLSDRLPRQVAHPLAGHGAARIVVTAAEGSVRHVRLQFDLRSVQVRLPVRTVPRIEAVDVSAVRTEQQEGKLPYATVTRTDLNRPAPALPAEAHYAVLKGDVRMRHEAGTWKFVAHDLFAAAAGERAKSGAKIEATLRGRTDAAFELKVDAESVDLPSLWPLALALAPHSFDRWAGLGPTGRIASLHLQASRPQDAGTLAFSVTADVAGLGVQPSARMPGFTGVTATLEGTEQRGALKLRARQPSFDWPRMFRAPIKLTTVDADVTWRRQGKAWVLGSRNARLVHPHARANANFNVAYLGADVSPVLDLTANVDVDDVTMVPGVLPVGRMHEKTLGWLDNAFKQGRAVNGKVACHGPIRKFPFRNGEGTFNASIDLKNVTLDYAQGFAPMTAAMGHAEFHNSSITAQLASGQVAGLRLGSAEFRLADYKYPVLAIKGAGTGDLATALGFLQASPLGERLGKVFMDLSGSGHARYATTLVLPVMAPDLQPPAGVKRTPDYVVHADLDGVNVVSPLLRAPAHAVTGKFELHNQEVRLQGVRGSILDGPFELTAVPGKTGVDVPMAIDFTARGTAGGAGLPAFIGLPAGIRMAGTTAWELRGHVEKRSSEGRWPVQINVASPLTGLEIFAPRPFAKAPGEARPTRVRLDLPGTHLDDVVVDSGPARARLRFAERDGRWRLDRGAARFDGQPVSLPAQSGLYVSGDWPHFDLGEWLALRGGAGTPVTPAATRLGGSARATGAGSGGRLSEWLGPVDVRLAHATVFGHRLDDLTARLRLDGETWRINVNGPQAQGLVSVPDDFGDDRPLVLDMKRLYLVPEPAVEGTSALAATPQTDPRTLPAITARVDDFAWQGRRFGKLQALLVKEPRGLVFQTLATTAPEFNIAGSGSWLLESGTPRTRVELALDSTDFAATERALGYRDSIEARKAHFSANLQWPGGPSADMLGKLNGTLKLTLEDGQLRDVEPGAGRMLGLLSVAHLPRRLALDFRDVTDKGLAFDKIHGDFELRDGDAHTQNLLVKGAAVDIGVAGRTGLKAEDYDQTIIVSGNPGGPLAVAGAFAAGPVVGAGVLLLSQLFKGQLQGLTRAYYHVTGPWSAPVVERMSASASASANVASEASEASTAPAAGGQP